MYLHKRISLRKIDLKSCGMFIFRKGRKCEYGKYRARFMSTLLEFLHLARFINENMGP